MILEILFGEVCNFFGDPMNTEYLRRTLKGTDAEFIDTPLDGKPYFASGRPDMIILGSMSESIQRRAIDALMPYKDRIEELIDDGVVFLATGNACEIFCSEINYETEEIIKKALGIFPLTVTNNLFKRYNGKVIGSFCGMTLTGFRSQFTMLQGDNSKFGFLDVERGIGINRESRTEGMHRSNFFGTQLLGPVLPLNPEFCRYLCRLAGSDVTPAFYDTAMAAYSQRVKEFRDPNVVFD